MANNHPNGPPNHPFSPYGYPDPMNAPGRDALSRGYLQQEARTNYYDVTHRTSNAVPSNPGFDSDVYDFENIRQTLQRNAPFLWVVNLGRDNLFVIISHNGSFESSHEAVIAPGEVKCYYNVWNLGLRSPTQGLLYQVTEYPIEINCCPTLSVSVSGNIVQISGQAVVTSISGDVVQISGQSVVASVSGEVVQISGQAVTTSVSGDIVQISGQSVVTDSGSVTSVSGNIVEISGQAVTTSISGDIVQISGQAVTTSISGDVVVTSVSGNIVITSVSGDIVQISGQAVTTSVSGDIVQISGQSVVTSVSGNIIITSVSGDIVQISGQSVVTSVSGNIIITSVSGNIVQISGQAVTTSVSGNIVQISGQAVTTSVSGNIVQISGQSVTTTVAAPTAIITGAAGSNPFAVTSASGGVAISSGVIVAADVTAVDINSGPIYIGGAAPYRPFSGFGYILNQGATIPMDISNLNAIFACATVSGDKINFIATAP